MEIYLESVRRLRAFAVYLLVGAALFAASPGAQASSPSRVRETLTCEAALAGVIGEYTAPIYDPEGLTAQIKNTRALDQCQTSECYLFALIGSIEIRNQNLLQRRDRPKFSVPYLVAQKLLRYAEEVIKNTDKVELDYDLKGGNHWDAVHLVRENGLVSEDSWQPKVPFKDWNIEKLYKALDEQGKTRRDYVRGQRKIFGAQSPQALKAEKEEIAILQNMILRWTGPLPETVTYKNKNLTPLEMEKKFGFEHDATIVMMAPEARRLDDPDYFNKELEALDKTYGEHWKKDFVSWGELEVTLKTWVDQKAPLIVDLTWDDGLHAMVLVDYEVVNGQVTHWKLKNSWGAEYGDQGYAWFTAEDFKANLIRTWRFVHYTGDQKP